MLDSLVVMGCVDERQIILMCCSRQTPCESLTGQGSPLHKLLLVEQLAAEM